MTRTHLTCFASTGQSHAHTSRAAPQLNEIVSCFDRLVEQHGLENIKPVSNAYMVAGGAPVARTDHAAAAAELAPAMLTSPPRSGHCVHAASRSAFDGAWQKRSPPVASAMQRRERRAPMNCPATQVWVGA